MKFLKWLGIIVLVLIVVYFLHQYLPLQSLNIHADFIISRCGEERQKIEIISAGNQRLAVVRFAVV